MMERFYTLEKLAIGSAVRIKESEHHHLTRVVRARENDEIELVDGRGSLGLAKIEKIDKEQTLLRILDLKETPPNHVQILMGIPFMRPSKLEWVMEKGTELGIDAFYLYPADKSTQNSLSEHQIERLQMITISALKQSRRLYLPHLEILPHLHSLLAKEGEIYFGDIRTSSSKLHWDGLKNILFITGPESGFSKEEVALLDTKGKGMRINPHVLRAETAPITAASILCFIRN